MRETKDQKIIRLEKKNSELVSVIKELKKELIEKKKEVNSIKKSQINECMELQTNEYNTLKRELNQIKNDHKTIVENLHSQLDSLIDNNLKLLNENEIYQKYIQSEKLNEWKEIEENLKEMNIILKWDELERYQSFNMGVCLDKFCCPFFNVKNLIITINPNNGKRLNDVQIEDILGSVRYNETYQECLSSVNDYIKDKDIDDLDCVEFIYEKGKYLYETLYKDHDFERFELD
jgi:hypothetical protein